MLGFSLPSRLFRTNHPANKDDALLHAFDNRLERLLTELKAAGVDSIELRMLSRSADGAQFQEVIQMIWETGLKLTVHGGLEGDATGGHFADVYPSMDYILANFRKYQDDLMIALHAFHDREAPDKDINETIQNLSRSTAARLQEWANMLASENQPIRIALELNRYKRPIIDPGSSCEGVVQMVAEVDRPNVGVCWDMGHYYSNLVTKHQLEDVPAEWIRELPPAAFIDRVAHTHIHGLSGRTGTHFPLANARSLPLELYVSTLRESGYEGVYNLELTWDLWEREAVREQTMQTIQRLSEAIR